MTNDEFKSLQPGDIVNHKNQQSNAYIILSNKNGVINAIPIIELTDPTAWVMNTTITIK